MDEKQENVNTDQQIRNNEEMSSVEIHEHEIPCSNSPESNKNYNITKSYIILCNGDNNQIEMKTSNTVIKSPSSADTMSSKEMQDICFIDKNTSLGTIVLEYDSSSPSDCENDDTIMKVSNNKDYRNKDEVVLSSDASVDSESDSSSSESESDSESSSSKKSDNNSDDSNDENQIETKGNRPKKVFKLKGEFDDLPPIEDLKISVPEVLCDPLGEVAWTVDQMVVVRPKVGKPTLNLDTVLFIEKGQRALGHIFDVFGQVAEPHYCVRFNSSDHIQECDVKVGMTVYYCPNTPYTSLVFLSELTKMKAMDDIGDDEPPQFSDDEEEQAYLTNLNNKLNNSKVKETPNETPNKRRRGNKSGWQSNHPWNSNKEQQNPYLQAQNTRPFYRSQHPWSRPRYQQYNWHQYNSFPNNQWIPQYPPYNEIQTYNEYPRPAQVSQMHMQNVRFPPMQWNPPYQLPQINTMPLQGLPQTLVPPFTLPPPPPPPPPPPSNADT